VETDIMLYLKHSCSWLRFITDWNRWCFCR